MSAMSQLMQRAQIFFWQPDPPLALGGRPKITGQASGQASASIVDLDELLSAVNTATHTATFAAGYDK